MIPDTPQTLLRKIAEYANGDDAAEWERFVELYTPVIRKFVSGRSDMTESDAEDVVQDIFIRLVEVLRTEQYRPYKGRFRAYLAAMVRRTLIDRYRRVAVRGAGREVPFESQPVFSDEPDVAAQVDARLRLARHAAAVEHVLTQTMLDARTVSAYRDYAINDEPAETVALRYGLTLNALRQIKFRLGRMIAAIEAGYGE